MGSPVVFSVVVPFALACAISGPEHPQPQPEEKSASPVGCSSFTAIVDSTQQITAPGKDCNQDNRQQKNSTSKFRHIIVLGK